MEGGRVARLKAPFTEWPSLAKLAELDSTSVAFRFGQAMGEELAAVGINVNFSPCVDLLTNEKNDLIGDRSLGNDPDLVSKLASAIVRGFIKSGVIPCAKHFPGHGGTSVDSHIDLPIDEVDEKTLQAIMLPPFKKVFRARLDMVMTAHVKYPHLDDQWPATLSEKILKGLLREDLRYRNLVVADDLDMKALTKNFNTKLIPIRALQAGVNILMYCHDQDSCAAALETVQSAASSKELDLLAINNSYDLIMKIKKEKLSQDDLGNFESTQNAIGHTDHKALAEGILNGNVPSDNQE